MMNLLEKDNLSFLTLKKLRIYKPYFLDYVWYNRTLELQRTH